MVDWWYHQLSLEAKARVMRNGVMTRLHFGVPEIVAEVKKIEAGMVSPMDVAELDRHVFVGYERFGRVTIAYLADIIRFSKRETPGNWHQNVKPPALLERCA